MKFLFHFYNLHERAGIQRAICEVSNALVEEGHEVTLATITQPSNIAYPLDNKIRTEQISNPEVRISGILAWPRKVIWAFRQVRDLRELVRRHCPSIVVDHGTALGLIYPFKFLGGAPFVLQRHFPVRDFPHGRLLYRILSAISGTRTVVVLTQAIAAEMRSNGFRNVVVIPNPVPAGAQFCPFSEARDRTGLLMGRAKNPQKGFDLFLKALAISRMDGWRFRIAGPGVDSDPMLLELLRSHGLEGRVELLPASEDPYELIRTSSCLIMPSRYEALPMVALEALSIGRPVIASDVDGLRELVIDGVNGLVFPRGNIEKLAECLTRIFAEPSQLEVLAAYANNSVAAYNRKRIVEQWEKLVAALSE